MDAKKYWEKEWKGKPRWPVSSFAEKALPIIKKAGLTEVLDLGCGAGRDSLYFEENGLSVTALDVSESGISKLREEKRANIRCIACDIRDIDFPDDSFDVIYAHLILQYLNHAEVEIIIEKLHKMLRKGGYIFVKCKSAEDPLYGQGKKIEENVFIHEHIRHFFTAEYMREILKNFDIKEVNVLPPEKRPVGHKFAVSAFIEGIAKKR